MKKLTMAAVLMAGLAASSMAAAQVTVGLPAPDFTGVDATGKTVSLASLKGKHVVLEWVNPDCPFVKKHYNSGNMQATQKHAAGKDAVWLMVSTTAKGAADKSAVSDLAGWVKTKNASPSSIVIDDGKIGKAYGARTTPHMYIVDPTGKLVYAGAIDSKPSANADDIAGATNYVKQAMDELASGKPVSKPATLPYGCSVKYG